MRKWLGAFGVEEKQYSLLQEINANQDKDQVLEEISSVINNVLDNKQAEKESMRGMFIIKLRQMLQEKR